jgi:hypothetical protein
MVDLFMWWMPMVKPSCVKMQGGVAARSSRFTESDPKVVAKFILVKKEFRVENKTSLTQMRDNLSVDRWCPWNDSIRAYSGYSGVTQSCKKHPLLWVHHKGM